MVEKKNLFPLEVPFRIFVAITFAGSLTFHVVGLGIHTYIGQKKNALVNQIESLAETRSRILGIMAGLSVLTERLRSVGREKDFRKEFTHSQLLPQIRVMTLLLKNEGKFFSGSNLSLSEDWSRTARSLTRCQKLVRNPALECFQNGSLLLSKFDRRLSEARSKVSLHLFHVEKFQSRLEHWDTILYWMTTVFGLLFMALGWRNVVLQVGNPIKDVAHYLETFQEEGAPAMSSLPALFSIRELRILKENMKNIHKDDLTGLLTRQAIGLILQNEMENAKRNQAPLAVVLLDIDRFRAVNERFGHEAGDAALRHVGKILSQSVRPKDWCGRWGEEEFLLVLPGLLPKKVDDFLESLRVRIAQPFDAPSTPTLQVSVSGGVSLYSEGKSQEEILAEAEGALSRIRKGEETDSFWESPESPPLIT